MLKKNALALFNDRPAWKPQVFHVPAPPFTSCLTSPSLSLHIYKMGFIELLEVHWMLYVNNSAQCLVSTKKKLVGKTNE